MEGTPVDFVHPLLDVVERLLICHVIHHDDAVRAAVVRRCDGAESLLSCRVPNLQFDRLSIELQRADFLRTCNIAGGREGEEAGESPKEKHRARK